MECPIEKQILEALEAGYARKGLKWVNGECVPMTPEEFTNYINALKGED